MKTVQNISAVLGLLLLVLITADIIAGWARSRKAITTPMPPPMRPTLMR